MEDKTIIKTKLLEMGIDDSIADLKAKNIVKIERALKNGKLREEDVHAKFFPDIVGNAKPFYILTGRYNFKDYCETKAMLGKYDFYQKLKEVYCEETESKTKPKSKI